MSEKQQFSLNVRWAAYAGLLFFRLLVDNELKSPLCLRSPLEKQFIASRSSAGNIVLLLGILALVFFMFAEWSGESRMMEIGGFLIGMLLIFLGYGVIMITYSKSAEISPISLTKDVKNQLLKLFIPWNGTNYWLVGYDVQKPLWRAKEAELWWGLIFLVGCFDFHGMGIIVIGSRFLIRLGGLILGWDIISLGGKMLGNQLFVKRIEEVLLLPKVLFSLKMYSKRSIGDVYKKNSLLLIQRGGLFVVWRFIFAISAIFLLIYGIFLGLRWKLFLIFWLVMRGLILIRRNQIYF